MIFNQGKIISLTIVWVWFV